MDTHFNKEDTPRVELNSPTTHVRSCLFPWTPTRDRPHHPRPGTGTGMLETLRAARHTWGCPRRVSKSLQSWTPPFPCPDRRDWTSREALKPCRSARKLPPPREGSFREGRGGRNPLLIKSSNLPSGRLGSKFPESWGGCPQQELRGGPLGETERQFLSPVRPVLPASQALGWIRSDQT